MSISTDDLGRITQETAVVTSDGDRLGQVHQVYTSDASGDPAWVTVNTGRFGSQESFVPLSDATFDGDDVRVAVTRDAVHDAPRVDAGGHLSVAEEDDLYRYYGITNPDHSEDDVAAAATGTERTDDDLPGEGTRAEDYQAAAEADTGRTDEPVGTDATTVGPAAGAGAAAGAVAAGAGSDRDEELAERDAEGRDEVADAAPAAGDAGLTEPRRARADDQPGAADDTGEGSGSENAVRPGERTTRLRRYVVTERVVQTIEELPDDDPR